MMRVAWAAAVAAWAIGGAASAAGVDPQVINQIADQGFNHGQVGETLEYLSDQIGGRMTNSPAMRKAEAWTSGRFRAWGLSNVRLQPFEFGRGWWIEAASVRMTAPRPVMLRAIPVAWTPRRRGRSRRPSWWRRCARRRTSPPGAASCAARSC